MENPLLRILSVCFLVLTFISSASAEYDPTKSYWDVYFKRKLFHPPEPFVVDALDALPHQQGSKTAIDLGSGVGHETLLLLKKGYRVTAIDSQPDSFMYMKKQAELQPYLNHLTPVVGMFENLNYNKIPKADLMVACFSLPFVAKHHFDRVWNNVSSRIKTGGYFVGSFFDPKTTLFEKTALSNMTFHTKEEVQNLFKDYTIITFKEVKLLSHRKGKRDFFYVVVAQKK